MKTEELDHVSARLALRPPRVAIVFEADEGDWMLTARRALARANQIWGGAGFVLVPHHGPDVSDALMRVLYAYDPDYVVGNREGQAFNTLTEVVRSDVALACSTYRRWQPGPDVSEVAGSERPEVGQVDLLGHGPKVPAWDAGRSDWDLDQAFLTEDSEGPLTPLASFGNEDPMCLHAPSSLGGALGLAVAAKVGAIGAPAEEDAEGGEAWGDTSGLDEMQTRQVAQWLLGPHSPNPDLPHALVYHHEGLELGVVPGSMPPAWQRTHIGLSRFQGGLPIHPVRHFVVGDGADDFALYLLLDRLYGEAVWIHSDWSPFAATSPAGAGEAGEAATKPAQVVAAARLGLRDQAWAAGRGRGFEVTITSATLPAANLKPFAETGSPLYIPPARVGFVDDSEDESGAGEGANKGASPGAEGLKEGRPHHTISIRQAVELPERGRLHYAMTNQFEIREHLPARVNAGGGLVLASPLKVVMPESPALSGNEKLNWQVDVSFDARTATGENGGVETLVDMPTGRRLDGHALLPTEEEAFDTWTRSSRAGISFDSRKYGWVSGTALGAQRVARPRLQQLDLASWVEKMARQNGYETEVSDMGMRAELLARLWGGRRQFTADMQGPVRDLVALFMRKGQDTRAAYPEGFGTLLQGSRGVLNVDGVSAPWALANPGSQTGGDQAGEADDGQEEVREAPREMALTARRALDSLLRRRILTRGLVIGCRHCRNVAFVDVDALGQTNMCARCGGQTELNVDAWHQPVSDPQWFYDVHPVMRDLVTDHGDAPLALADYLARRSRNYADVGETNLLRPGIRRPVAESDVIAHADGQVITAEVKTSNDLETNKDRRMAAAVKRVLWARVVAADEIILATTQPTWKPASIDAMKTVMREARRGAVWAPGALPRLRVISGLGTPGLVDETVEVF